MLLSWNNKGKLGMGEAHVAEGGTAVETLACPGAVGERVPDCLNLPPFLINRYLDVLLLNVSNGEDSALAKQRRTKPLARYPMP